MTTSSKKRKKSADPQMTSRKRRSSCSKSGAKIGINSRVKTTRSNLYHALISDVQRECLPSTQANNHNYYGTVVSGSSSKGYNVRFDALPHEENIVESFSRQKLTVVLAGEEEKDYDHPPQFDSETTATTSNKTLFTKSADDFCSMSEKDIAVAKCFEMRYGNNDGDRIKWEILADNVHIQEDDDDCMNIPNKAELIPEIDLETPHLSSTFFKHFPRQTSIKHT